jgi:hypothetical protein
MADMQLKWLVQVWLRAETTVQAASSIKKEVHIMLTENG